MLGEEDGMAAHGRLPPVILRMRRCKPLPHKLLCMAAYLRQPFLRGVPLQRLRQPEAAAKRRTLQPAEGIDEPVV